MLVTVPPFVRLSSFDTAGGDEPRIGLDINGDLNWSLALAVVGYVIDVFYVHLGQCANDKRQFSNQRRPEGENYCLIHKETQVIRDGL